MKTYINWDALGISASLACAIHCALLPLFLTSLPLFGINIIHNLFFEAGMIVLALLVGGIALFHGYRRHHHRPLPILLFFLGMTFLIIKQFMTASEYWILFPAVFLIITAHYLNWRYCRIARHCHTSDCTH